MVAEIESRLAEGPRIGDAFGAALLDYFTGKSVPEIIERDDGLLIVNSSIGHYLDPPSAWSALGRRAVERAQGRVLDVGCGAGRHAIILQDRSHDVIGLDISPEALEVARRRGLYSTFLGTIDEHAESGPTYDTFLLLGGNLCLLGSPDKALAMLRTLAYMAAPGATIIGQGIDPYLIDNPLYLEYYERNRERGLPPGQMHYRARYKNIATPWSDDLYCSPSELERLVEGNDWRVIDIDQEEGRPFYTAILRKVT